MPLLTAEGGFVLDEVLLEGILFEVKEEILRASRKHREESMAAPGHSLGKRMGIIVEESGEVSEAASLAAALRVLGPNAALQGQVGQVARATTYDNGSAANLREELVQLAAMSVAWVAAGEAAGEFGEAQQVD